MPYTITIPAPMPADGFRKLTPRETMQRARALTCINSKESSECQGQVYASLFFDGTGNNKDWNEPGLNGTQTACGKHSNVARLFNSSIDDLENGFFPFYIPGLGTPWDKIGDDTEWLTDWAGMGAGYMGADRINWGITRVYNALHAYLTGTVLFDDSEAKLIVNNMSSSLSNLLFETPYRRRALRNWEKELATVVKNSQRKVTQINVAVFGFSRGAAEARVFANWLCELLKQDDGGYFLAGVPLRLYFMGLFDTVASVGSPSAIPGFDGHMAWADGNMHIHPAVEQCVHFIALHEQRGSFPLEMAAKVKQVAYPGVHSDVGGGYLPTEQGKLSQLSQIPLIDMHHEAIKAGVPLRTVEEIKQRPDLVQDFACPPALIQAVNAFWDECGIGAASGKDSVLDVIHQHTRQYLQWRAGLFNAGQGLSTRRFYKQSTLKDQKDLVEAQNDFTYQMAEVRERMRVTKGKSDDLLFASSPLETLSYRAFNEDPSEPVDATTQGMLAAINNAANLPDGVSKLMDDYIHDSRAGFHVAKKLEPYRITGGYLRYRTIYQNAWTGDQTAANTQPVSTSQASAQTTFAQLA
ncbi:T6SS phospholipase effector Tle1-like catalytic domain-containing protein [Dyella caseinilytica]|uniref:DUF2235 domain-containing protein n=1 Tax=Dyella caseinilytica TaxID=1849581 RepID=A0ABX7H0S8_9GAMM|nr:DUF2235 domain-containing protein [Dyella caseinilytica]QRN55025.1 DUF2235 domain-containing protein [Dyella caseinilytica]GFZ98781.1 hypothetical protein GCM10011408_19290 [Dyella caseinilytica]